MLFSGTVRSNVDPLEQAGGDDKVWEALDQAGLRPTVSAMEVRILLLSVCKYQSSIRGATHERQGVRAWAVTSVRESKLTSTPRK